MSTPPLRIVQYGLGPIGLGSLREVLRKQEAGFVELVGAIDIDPAKVGRDVSDLLENQAATGVLVSDDADAVLRDTKPDVVLHTTSSFLDGVRDQLIGCAHAGVHVVSSTEELSFPFDRHPDLAQELDHVAKEHNVVFLGTGVNPGYAMDTLVLAATGVCTDVSTITSERVVDAGLRRGPLQRKVGAGLTRGAFEEKKLTGKFGHIGLRESLLMIADGLGWSFERIEETLEPVISDRDIETPILTVKAGQVAGIHHAIKGIHNGSVRLSLDLKMYVGADDPRDAVFVDGTPPVDLVIRGGIFGDTATVATLVNAIPLVMTATPGLRTMGTMPVPRAFGTA